MRIDRAATLALFHPVARIWPGGAAAILMYHSVSDEREDDVHPYFRVNTSPAQFARQMEVLKASGWDVVPLAELATSPTNATRRVAITFDDGYEDFLSAAFPVLQQHGYAASVFLPTAYIGDRPREFKGRPCLSWSQVKELAKAGVEFGSHTVNHPQLHGLPEQILREEVYRSKQEIEERLGRAISSFCYPYAFPEHDRVFCTGFRTLLAEAGYSYGVCTALGRVRSDSDQFFLRRLPVNTLDDERLLLAKLEGGYDWLHGVQYLVKALKRKAA
jgi:peptidoglycan/xylan/chitin deacetylase (PgdA/CDA1 family)